MLFRNSEKIFIKLVLKQFDNDRAITITKLVTYYMNQTILTQSFTSKRHSFCCSFRILAKYLLLYTYIYAFAIRYSTTNMVAWSSCTRKQVKRVIYGKTRPSGNLSVNLYLQFLKSDGYRRRIYVQNDVLWYFKKPCWHIVYQNDTVHQM